MNFSIIRKTLGFLLVFEGIFFLVPTITAACYGEWSELLVFLACAVACAGIGVACVLKKVKNNQMYAKEAFVVVALSWIVMSLFGCIPFLLIAKTSFINALFETVSGFTTTGSSIFLGEQIDGMAKSLLMWRSFTHWVGGMGVLVFVMAFLPLSGAKNMHLMKAESPGPVVSKLVPKVRQTAVILYAIYSVMTVLEFGILLVGDMTIFEALTTAFATAGTGGFSISSQGMAYGPFVQVVVTVFMLLFSINFTSYYLFLRGKLKDAWSAEVKAFIAIVFGAIALVTLNVHYMGNFEGKGSFLDTLRQSAFYVASIVSTTGFGIEVDFSFFPQLSIIILILLMFIGACAGSTGGGMKVSRWMILSKGGTHEVGRLLHPKRVKKIVMDGKVVEHEVVRSVNAYLVMYILIFVVSLLLISLDPLVQGDFTTAFTSVATTLNNIGPGVGSIIGPTGSFADFTVFSKVVYIFDMLAGRLEIFPMLVLFAPATWRRVA